MQTTIYLLRHGQSEGNALGRFQGQADWGLTDLGRQQAQCAAQATRDLPLDRIYASDLCRAWDTTQPVADCHGLTIRPAPGFREIWAGQWETHRFTDLMVRYAADYTCWQTDLAHARPTGGESVAQLYERVWTALTQIEAESRGLTVLVGTHATPIRMLLARIQQGSLAAANDLRWVPNCSLTKLVCTDGQWSVVYAGDDRHMGALQTNLPATV